MDVPSEDIPCLFLVGSVGGFFGGIVVAIFADVLGRKATGLGVSLLSALSTLTLIYLGDFYVAFALYSFIAFSFASVAYMGRNGDLSLLPEGNGYRAYLYNWKSRGSSCSSSGVSSEWKQRASL